MKLKRQIGSSQIEVAGIKFTVRITRTAVELQAFRKDELESNKIIEQIKNVYGNDFDIRKRQYNNKIKITIPWTEIIKHKDIKTKILIKLYEMLNQVEDQRRRKWIMKNIQKLTQNKIT